MLLDRGGERSLHLHCERRVCRRVVRLRQRVPRVARQRIGQRRELLACERDALARDQLETGKPIAERLAQQAKQRDRCVDVGEGRQRGRGSARLRKELQHRRGDDAERAFAAEEELLDVVAGVVFAQALEAVPDTAVGEHDLQTENELACIAVTKHRGAAGVGRQVPADRAAALGREREGEQQSGIVRRLLDAGERHARFDRERRVAGVERAYASQTRQRNDDLTAIFARRRSAAQSGIAPLGNHRRAMLRAAAHDRRHIGSGRRAHDGTRTPAIAAAPVGDVGSDIGIGSQNVGLTDDGLQRGQQGSGRFRHGALY